MGSASSSSSAASIGPDTAVQFAAYEVATLGFSNHEVVITRGDAFADALAGAQYVGDPKR